MWYCPNRKKSQEGEFRNGKLVGSLTYYDENGNYRAGATPQQQLKRIDDAAGILVMAQFSIVSIPEKITKQMISESKSSIWIFMKTKISVNMGGNPTEYFTVVTCEYRKDNESYLLICKNKENVEYNIEYKIANPKQCAGY